MGEQVAAFGRPAPGQTPAPEELFAYCREHLAPHKRPRYWTVLEEFPQTPAGMIQKFVLRERFLAQGARRRDPGPRFRHRCRGPTRLMIMVAALADPDPTVETLRATCEELVELGDQQERLIMALLTLASSQRGIGQLECLDLADIAQDALLARQEEAERHGIRLRAALAAAPVTGDPNLAESLVANLLDNAIRHNLPGGQAEISTALTTAGAVISVSNTGRLVPPDAVQDLFQPFRQLGTQRTRCGEGHGLGLAIVRAIADAHGAALTARARPAGGLDIQVTFPLTSTARQANIPDMTAQLTKGPYIQHADLVP